MVEITPYERFYYNYGRTRDFKGKIEYLFERLDDAVMLDGHADDTDIKIIEILYGYAEDSKRAKIANRLWEIIDYAEKIDSIWFRKSDNRILLSTIKDELDWMLRNYR